MAWKTGIHPVRAKALDLYKTAKLLFVGSGGTRGQYCLFFLSLLVISILDVVGVGALPIFVAVLAQPDIVREKVIAFFPGYIEVLSHPDSFVYAACFALASIFMCKNALAALISFSQARFVASRQATLAKTLLAQLLDQPYLFHVNRNSAAMQRVIGEDAFSVVIGFFIPASLVLIEVFVALFIVTAIVLTDWMAALAMVGIFGCILLFFFRQRFRWNATDICTRSSKYRVFFNYSSLHSKLSATYCCNISSRS